MQNYDYFISFAWDDREIASQIAASLQKEGLQIWFAGSQLKPGDSVTSSIEDGIINSRYGIVIISPNYLGKVGNTNSKYWLILERNSLQQKEVEGKTVIIPIWHNVTDKDVRALSPNLADRFAIQWSEGLEKVTRQLIDLRYPIQKSLRRSSLERKLFDRFYHFGDATSPALRLVGAGSEFFTKEDVLVYRSNEQYFLPSKYRNQRDELVKKLEDETKSKHKSIFNGPATRMVGYQITTPNPATEKKALNLTLAPLRYYDYAIARRLSDAAMEDDGEDQLEDFVNIETIAAGGNLSLSSLSNIVDTTTTVVTRDGYLLFVERGSQVSDRGGWYTCSVAEGIQEEKDNIDFSAEGQIRGGPFLTVVRGVSEELSPILGERLETGEWIAHLRMLGISYDLEGFHPDLIFLLTLPIDHDDIRSICRQFPGVDSPVEGMLKSTDISNGTHDIVRRLVTTKWTPGGAASVVRSLEFLSSISREQHLGSIKNAVEWLIDSSSRNNSVQT